MLPQVMERDTVLPQVMARDTALPQVMASDPVLPKVIDIRLIFFAVEFQQNDDINNGILKSAASVQRRHTES